ITCPSGVIRKIPNIGRDVNELSVDTVKGFAKDIQKSGLSIL
ncbi:transaldolase, partial [Staphylococcus condimenti]